MDVEFVKQKLLDRLWTLPETADTHDEREDIYHKARLLVYLFLWLVDRPHAQKDGYQGVMELAKTKGIDAQGKSIY